MAIMPGIILRHGDHFYLLRRVILKRVSCKSINTLLCEINGDNGDMCWRPMAHFSGFVVACVAVARS